MKEFRYVEDVEAWFAPMSYLEFWTAVAPLGLKISNRDHCDDQLARKLVDEETILGCLKHMAMLDLRARYGLERRPVTPWLKVVD